MNLKHRVRDFLIALFSILGIVFAYRLYMKRTGPLVRIVVFHDVQDTAWFEEVIKMLNKKYHLITPQEFRDKAFDRKNINVLLTFDDGYQSWVEVCAPILKKYTAKAIFFINSGLLDVSNDSLKVSEFMHNQLLISPKKPLTWDMAVELVAEGHTIGGHTVTHPNLALLQSIDTEVEIATDKQRIEQVLGVQLLDFAYPFGRQNNYTSQTFDATLKAGYTFVYTATTGFVDVQNSKNIKRVCLEKNQPLQSVCSWIEGGYDVLHAIW